MLSLKCVILKIFEQNGLFNTTEKDLESVLKTPILQDVIKYARSKVEVKNIQEQDTANRSYPVMKEVRQILEKSTGSGVGATVDDLARIVGASPDGAQIIAQLQPLAGRLVSYVPRFEGAQSDRDVIEYRKQAGDFANPNLTVKERMAGLKGLISIMKIMDKESKNDWGSIISAAPQTPADKAKAELKKRSEGQR